MAGQLRELMLLRHAKSDWKTPDMQDIDRPLSDKGKKNAIKLGKWLSDHNLMPDLILASPAIRAQQTLKRICNECSASAIVIDRLYNADISLLQQVLSEAPFAERIMIIGHNPGLEQLFNLLNGQDSRDGIQLFPTCSMAHFIMPNDWSHLNSGDGKLQQFITPKDLKSSAKN